MVIHTWCVVLLPQGSTGSRPTHGTPFMSPPGWYRCRKRSCFKTPGCKAGDILVLTSGPRALAHARRTEHSPLPSTVFKVIDIFVVSYFPSSSFFEKTSPNIYFPFYLWPPDCLYGAIVNQLWTLDGKGKLQFEH